MIAQTRLANDLVTLSVGEVLCDDRNVLRLVDLESALEERLTDSLDW